MFIFLKRIFHTGFQNFQRQGNLSFATCLILVITICLISFVFLSHEILDFAVAEIKARADVSVYFQEDCTKEDIFELKDRLDEFPNVSEIEYVSKEQALEQFIERHQQEKDIMESLQQLGANPLLASLNIKATNVGSYEEIALFLEAEELNEIIEKVDFSKRRPVIENIFRATAFVDRAGITVSLILILVATLVSYNTVRLTIYTRKQEIGIARLVGASNWLIRGPFLVQGAICGFLAFVLSLIIVGISFQFLNSKISFFFTGFQIFSFFKNNLAMIVLIQFFTGLFLTVVPSFIAIRKYLEV